MYNTLILIDQKSKGSPFYCLDITKPLYTYTIYICSAWTKKKKKNSTLNSFPTMFSIKTLFFLSWNSIYKYGCIIWVPGEMLWLAKAILLKWIEFFICSKGVFKKFARLPMIAIQITIMSTHIHIYLYIWIYVFFSVYIWRVLRVKSLE